MKTTTTAAQQGTWTVAGIEALARRVKAMREELSETQRRAERGERGATVMVQALKKDIFEQESKLAYLVAA